MTRWFVGVEKDLLFVSYICTPQSPSAIISASGPSNGAECAETLCSHSFPGVVSAFTVHWSVLQRPPGPPSGSPRSPVKAPHMVAFPCMAIDNALQKVRGEQVSNDA